MLKIVRPEIRRTKTICMYFTRAHTQKAVSSNRHVSRRHKVLINDSRQNTAGHRRTLQVTEPDLGLSYFFSLSAPAVGFVGLPESKMQQPHTPSVVLLVIILT